MSESMRPFLPSVLQSLRHGAALPGRLLFLASNAAVGGQAVMEGVMMRSPNHWAVALRRRSDEIVEIHRDHSSFARKHSWARLPVLRGVVALGESLVIGFKALSVSAHFAASDMLAEIDEDEAAKSADAKVAGSEPAAVADAAAGVEGAKVIELDKHRDGAAWDRSPTASTPETDDPDSDASPDSLSTWQIVVAFIFAFGFSIALFKLLPAALTNFAFVETESRWFVVVEASVRITIFCVYLALIGLLPDMKRVFQYHSAEHKAINAWENGIELTPELVNQQSRIHVRCGTAFMLWVFVVAIIVFGVFREIAHPDLLTALASRVIFFPLIAGLSFELIKFAGRHANSRLVRGIMAPGLWLQWLTTRQCTEEQCEVAVRSLQLVLEREYPDASLEQARVESSSDEDEAMQVMA